MAGLGEALQTLGAGMRQSTALDRLREAIERKRQEEANKFFAGQQQPSLTPLGQRAYSGEDIGLSQLGQQPLTQPLVDPVEAERLTLEKFGIMPTAPVREAPERKQTESTEFEKLQLKHEQNLEIEGLRHNNKMQRIRANRGKADTLKGNQQKLDALKTQLNDVSKEYNALQRMVSDLNQPWITNKSKLPEYEQNLKELEQERDLLKEQIQAFGKSTGEIKPDKRLNVLDALEGL